jgi:branched-chain amino acid aminotransferase
MTTKVYLSTVGRPVDPADANVSVFDRGFLYGDSVYETMRTAGGRPVAFGRHLERLHKSAEGIGLRLPFADAELAELVAQTHAASGNDESYVRIVVTRGRGTGPLMLDTRGATHPTLVVVVQDLVVPPPPTYERGISVVIVSLTKTGGSLDPALKTGNYLGNILATREAITKGAEDAILCNAAGDIAEGATSNVFVYDNGQLRTPSLDAGLLAGITREIVCRLARDLGYPVIEQAVSPAELRGAEEVFLTSSIRGVMPVAIVDEQTIGRGREGPVTHAIRLAYEAYLARLAAHPVA